MTGWGDHDIDAPFEERQWHAGLQRMVLPLKQQQETHWTRSLACFRGHLTSSRAFLCAYRGGIYGHRSQRAMAWEDRAGVAAVFLRLKTCRILPQEALPNTGMHNPQALAPLVPRPAVASAKAIALPSRPRQKTGLAASQRRDISLTKYFTYSPG